MDQKKEPQTDRPEKDQAENQADQKSEKKAAPKTENQGKKGKGSSFFHSAKFKHGGMATAFTAGFIAVLVLVNVLVGILSDKYPSVNLDVTKAGTNTLSAATMKIVDSDKMKTTISICATKQACESNSVGSGGGDYSQVSRLISKAAERNHNISVQYIDLDKDPTFARNYQSDSIAAGDVVVETTKRHRVLTSNDLFTTQTGSDGTSQTYFSNVDSALASALNAVTSEAMPVAAFDTGHSEQLDSSGYKRVLQNNSFETKDFSLLTDAIPANTQLLVLGCPTTDYTDNEIAKIDSFLHSKTASTDRSVLITGSAGQPTLTKLSAYMAEWGLSLQPSDVVQESDSQKCYDNNPLYIVGEVQNTPDLGAANASYSNFAVPYSCPVNIKAQTVGSKTTYSLIKSSDSSVLYRSSKKTNDSQSASQNLVALSQESVQANGKTHHANLIVTGSSLMFGSDLVNASAFSNAAYSVNLSKYATGTTASSTNITTTNHQLYAKDISINSSQVIALGYGVFTILIPLAVAVTGILVYRKRRTL